MNRLAALLLLALLLGGCASAPPPLSPWRADPMLAALPADCAGSAAAAGSLPASVVPGGLALVRSDSREILLIAARTCLWALDATAASLEVLPTHGDAIAPTMVDASSGGLVFSSSLSGSVRAIDTDGDVTFNVSGLRHPLGVRLLPGGSAVVAEHGTGRVLRLGPTEEYRARMIVDGLDGPAGIVIADATTGYVTERDAGHVTLFRLDRFEKRVLVRGLDRPEGITRMSDQRLAVVETGKRRLIAVDPASGTIEVMADNLPITPLPRQEAYEGHSFTDVVAAPGGWLYLNVVRDRTILKVTRRAAR